MKTRILIVEDEPAAQLVLGRLVARMSSGVRVACVGSAEEALWTLNEAAEDADPYDLVISDLYLPGSDGLKLFEIAQKQHPAVDFLFVSGATYDDWEQKVSALEESPEFLRKPISAQALRQAIAGLKPTVRP
jgi:DNA-binding NtrC family response regulator